MQNQRKAVTIINTRQICFSRPELSTISQLTFSENDNHFIIVLTGRYIKLTLAVPMTKKTASYVAFVLLDNFIFPYGISNTVLSYNRPQFIFSFWMTASYVLGIRRNTSTTYHPQPNGQVEHYNRTISTRLLHYVSGRHKNWDQFLQPPTYAHSTQMHISTGTTAFNLTVTRPSPCVILEKSPIISPTIDEDVPHQVSRCEQAHSSGYPSFFDETDIRSERDRAQK